MEGGGGGIYVAFKIGDNYKLLPSPNYSIENVNILLRIIHGVYLEHGNIQGIPSRTFVEYSI